MLHTGKLSVPGRKLCVIVAFFSTNSSAQVRRLYVAGAINPGLMPKGQHGGFGGGSGEGGVRGGRGGGSSGKSINHREFRQGGHRAGRRTEKFSPEL